MLKELIVTAIGILFWIITMDNLEMSIVIPLWLVILYFYIELLLNQNKDLKKNKRIQLFLILNLSIAELILYNNLLDKKQVSNYILLSFLMIWEWLVSKRTEEYSM